MQSNIDEINIKRKEAYDLLQQKNWQRASELFQQIFDGADPAIATCLGFIFDQKDESIYDREKSIEYYKIGAIAGNTYAEYALAGLMLAKGESSQAIDWYRRCSAAGEANCSYMAYRLYKVQNNEQEAIRFLEVASRQGHPVAIQKLSFYYISGRFGISGIVKGVVMYINNIPKLFKFARQNIAVDEPNLPL